MHSMVAQVWCHVLSEFQTSQCIINFLLTKLNAIAAAQDKEDNLEGKQLDSIMAV